MVFNTIGVRFNRKKGNIDIAVENQSEAMIKGWALFNTTGSKDTIVFHKYDGKVIAYYQGRKNDMPIITEDKDTDLGYIDDYCEGLLEAMQE